jgi:hypothetical protein
MVLPLVLLLSVATAQVDPWDEDTYDEEEDRDRILVSAWGGNAWETGTRGGGSFALAGGEVAYAFDSMDVGIAGYGYRLPDEKDPWTPVVMLRLVNRFPAGRGLEATFGFGLGAARPDDWVAWFQVALGFRLDLGPAFLGGELAFEQYDVLRLVGGVGVKF